MSRNTKHIAGFAALNTGVICDCYSAVRMKVRGSVSGFCSENKGDIHRCLFRGKISKADPKSGFCAQQNGLQGNNAWVKWKKSSKAEQFTDWSLGICRDDLEGEAFPEFLNSWDLNKTWLLENRVLGLTAGPMPSADTLHTHVIEICCKGDLLALANSVNEGTAPSGAVYSLKNDINLGGHKWTPIGTDPQNAFSGIFYGNGHTIKNFRINTTKHHYAGLFGCISSTGSVIGLTVDCILTGKGNCSGAICGRNEGHIKYCVARAETSLSRYTGGFVGQNSGTISNSCAHGAVKPPVLPIPWWLLLLLLLLLSLAFSITFYLNSREPGTEIFAPVILDPNAQPFEDTIAAPDPEEISESNATFIMNAEMAVSTQNYAGVIGLRCPSWSNRGFVATIRVTREDLSAHGLQYEDDFTTIYQSGLIQPGYGVDVITLSALPNGEKLPLGSYEFSVLFEFYDIETNEKSAVDSVVPLDVLIS